MKNFKKLALLLSLGLICGQQAVAMDKAFSWLKNFLCSYQEEPLPHDGRMSPHRVRRGMQSVRDYHGKILLHHAAMFGNAELVKKLLEAEGIDVNVRDDYGNTPLYLAARKCRDKVVELLLGAEGIDVNARRTGKGYTPLHSAACDGFYEVVELLLGAEGIDVNTRTGSGWTPLHFAAFLGRDKVVRLLLVIGKANTKLKVSEYNRRDNKMKMTALDIAKRERNCKVAKVIEDHTKKQKMCVDDIRERFDFLFNNDNEDSLPEGAIKIGVAGCFEQKISKRFL